MEYPIERSWWETLTRTDLDKQASERGQHWKAEKGHYSYQLGIDQMRDIWDLGIRLPKGRDDL